MTEKQQTPLPGVPAHQMRGVRGAGLPVLPIFYFGLKERFS